MGLIRIRLKSSYPKHNGGDLNECLIAIMFITIKPMKFVMQTFHSRAVCCDGIRDKKGQKNLKHIGARDISVKYFVVVIYDCQHRSYN